MADQGFSLVDMLLVTCYCILQAQLYKMWQVVEQKKKENAEMRKRIELEERMAALDRTLDVQVCVWGAANSGGCTYSFRVKKRVVLICDYWQSHTSSNTLDWSHRKPHPSY